MKVIINAGHYLKDSGAIHKDHRESDLAIAIRNEVKKLLPNALYVPDNLDLRESINFVNRNIEGNTLAVTIHLNSHNNPNIRGTEAYYAQNADISDVFARKVSEALNIPNRGSKHDSEAYVGSLGWLRKTKCNSVLLEVCYMTNEKDMEALDIRQTAVGIVRAIKTQEQISWIKKQIQNLIRQISLLINI